MGNDLSVTWNRTVAQVKNTYCNIASDHFSCIDHFIVTPNVLDSIIQHDERSDVTNPEPDH